ncbi:hypothetical protein DWG17_27955, partial [Salmonella enterica subsp. enterica serovar Senftenberg]
EALKVLVAEELTPYASSMLLDPEYGLPATKVLEIEALKVLVAEELTPYASSMLLDPEYGLPATKVL